MKLLWELEYEVQKAQERILKRFGEPEVMTFREVMDCGFNIVRIRNEDGRLVCDGFRLEESQDSDGEPAYSRCWECYDHGRELDLEQKVLISISDIQYSEEAPFHLEAEAVLVEK